MTYSTLILFGLLCCMSLSVMGLRLVPDLACRVRAAGRRLSDIHAIGPHATQRQVAVALNAVDPDLDRELDVFFEKAAISGSKSIRNLTPEERMERGKSW